MEFERTASVRPVCADGRLRWIERDAPDHPAQYQPACERRTSISRAIELEPDITGYRSWEYHPGGKLRQFNLQRRLGDSQAAAYT